MNEAFAAAARRLFSWAGRARARWGERDGKRIRTLPRSSGRACGSPVGADYGVGRPARARTGNRRASHETPAPHRLRNFQLALAASAVVALGACSRATPRPPPTNTPNDTLRRSSSRPCRRRRPRPRRRRRPRAGARAVAQAGSATLTPGPPRPAAPGRPPRRTPELPPRADRDTDVAPTQREIDAQRRHEQQVAADACQECGVVESVNAVKVQGQNNGVGAVAGGVGGALVGNRIAGSHNRTLGGVLGAVGGGLLGNAIEKHQRSHDRLRRQRPHERRQPAHGARVDGAGGGREGACRVRRPARAKLTGAGPSSCAQSQDPRVRTSWPRGILRQSRRMTPRVPASLAPMAATSASVGAAWFIV